MIWSKNAFIIKAGLSFTAFLAACGGDSSSKAEPSDIALREVSTIYDLGSCTADRYGDTVFVYDKAVDYLCVNNDWLDITTPLDNLTPSDNQSDGLESGLSSFIDEDVLSSSSFVDDPIRNDSNSATPTQQINQDYAVVLTKEKLPTCSFDNDKQRILVQSDSVLYTCLSKKWEPKESKGYIVKDASILGVAQKGPFKVKSPLLLSEVLLRNDSLVCTGRKYNGEISSNKGDYVISKVSLIYPYAVLEVRGQWRNEISGNYSNDSMTLRVLTDLSKRTEVNVNLLTHLEYDRAVKLVNKGYNVYAAKTQAEHEIMTAFGFATSVEYSEDLKIFVPSTNTPHNANATLMAISLLFIADKNDADVQKSINDFRNDFAEDGSWDNEQMKANMADWAEDFDGDSIHANVKSWNILDIPEYESFLTIFWNNAYGLGGCDQIRYGVVSPVSNKFSKNYEVHYICKENGWIKASDYEKDTYGWVEGRTGELKKGDVTDAIYAYNGSKWVLAERENTIGLCGETNAGKVSLYDSIYYICKNDAWEKASVLEYDTYDKVCLTDGSIIDGRIIPVNKYVCDAGAFRELSDMEKSLGKACVSYTENDVIKKSMSKLMDSVYTCKNSLWRAEFMEKDGVLFDKRDSNVYKTVVIGTQTWMAENLNYADSLFYSGMKGRSWCSRNSADSCEKYGLLYTWAAAMDSAGTFSTNGKGCGFYTCSPTYPVRGICPEGWHLPTSAEWKVLYSAMGSSPYAAQAKGYDYWPNATDAYGFSALPAGFYIGGSINSVGVIARFWSANPYEGNNMYATAWYLDAESMYSSSGTSKRFGCSVRCIKDSVE